MSDNGPKNLTLRLPRSIDEKLDRAIDELRDLKVRATALEGGLAGVNRRLDRADPRLDRIERLPNLAEAPQGSHASLAPLAAHGSRRGNRGAQHARRAIYRCETNRSGVYLNLTQAVGRRAAGTTVP